MTSLAFKCPGARSPSRARWRCERSQLTINLRKMKDMNSKSRGYVVKSMKLGAAAGLLLLSGCDAKDDHGGSSGGDAGPLYAIVGVVSDADSATTYVSLLSSLDVKEIDYSQAY